MNPPRRRICLITPGHLASTPRVVKEAEALSAAGYDVHLIASQHFPPVEPLDQAVLARATWRTTRVRTHAGMGVMLNRLRRHWLRRCQPKPGQLTLRQAELWSHPGLARLVDAAVATRADFFHGHCVAGLSAAARAARLRGVDFGFDAEDFHEAETVEAEHDPVEGAVLHRIMGAHLREAKVLTAAAPLIAAEYTRLHRVAMRVVLNVFPLRDAPVGPSRAHAFTATAPARLYWFSQTIGPGRGLERMMDVVRAMRTPARVLLRGCVSASYADQLRKRAGRADAIEFLPPGLPDEMVRLAAAADVGLALEERVPRNRDLCLTNKVFVYLLAGVPQVLSSTAAQVALAPELAEAGLLADFDQPAETARRLDDWLGDTSRQQAARDAAWQLARERFCWEVEREQLLAEFSAKLPRT